MRKIFVTGASGFVGKPLCRELAQRQLSYIAGVRSATLDSEISYGDFLKQNNWQALLKDVSVIIHLAARVHVMKEEASDPLSAFREMNCEATLRLAVAAKESGIKRFIFISSVKVNGERTYGRPFGPDDSPAPEDPYGISKAEAEKKLLELHESGVFEVVIIRPPLIYGPGVKANFKNLMYLVQRDLPIPFGRVDFNKRSLVSVYNLIDLIILCTHHPKAGGNIFLVSDDRDLSLKELILEMGRVFKKTPHLIPVPVTLMKWIAKGLGKSSYSDRLFGNLQVDISKTKTLLHWHPTYGLEETFLENCS